MFSGAGRKEELEKKSEKRRKRKEQQNSCISTAWLVAFPLFPPRGSSFDHPPAALITYCLIENGSCSEQSPDKHTHTTAHNTPTHEHTRITKKYKHGHI